MYRSAENERVGNVTIAAWQMEERADQRMSVGRLPDSINGRVRDAGRDSKFNVWVQLNSLNAEVDVFCIVIKGINYCR